MCRLKSSPSRGFWIQTLLCFVLSKWYLKGQMVFLIFFLAKLKQTKTKCNHTLVWHSPTQN